MTIIKSINGFIVAILALVQLVGCNEKSDISLKVNPKSGYSIVIQDYRTDTYLSPGTKRFLKILNTSESTPLETLSLEETRNIFINAQAGIDVDLSGIEESEETILCDGYILKLHIVRPEGNRKKLPAFIFVHGGGWVLGDYSSHKRMVRDLVVASGHVAVFVNYSLSPEAQYPMAINEIYAATKWVAEHGDEINVDGKKLGIVGNSVGGNMAVVTALMAKDKKEPEIKAQLLLWPVTDAKFNTLSYYKYGKERFLTSSLMKWMFDQYTTDLEKRKNIYISPLRATIAQLKGLPPTLIITAENDILRDEAEAFGRKLELADVHITTVRYNGVIHDFGLINSLATEPQTKQLFRQLGAELKKHLDGERFPGMKNTTTIF